MTEMQPFELDIEWCLQESRRKNFVKPSDDLLEAFAEGVAKELLVCEFTNLDEDAAKARKSVFSRMFE